MTEELVVQIIRQGLLTVLTAAAPVLIVGLVVGLVVSIFQAVSQVHEMTLTFIPKIVAIFFAIIIFGPWMINVIMHFATSIFSNLAQFSRM